MTKEELREVIAIDENYRIELTVSTGDMDKFQEAICAFANDMPGSRKKGYLLIGVKNNGQIDGLKVDDALMKKISGIRSDGNILPLPVMSTEKVVTEEGDVLVVEVTPSFDTPVRYRGRTFIRIGPRRDIASAEEERILAERCAASLPTFDTRPCRDAKLDDIDVDTIVKEYMPKAIDEETLNYVNMFNHGVGEVQELLKENDSPVAEFNVSYLTAFSVVVRESEESNLPKLTQAGGKALSTENQEVMNKLFQAFPNFGKAHAQVLTTMLHTCKSPSMVKNIMATCGVSSRTTFDRVYFGPIKEMGLVLPTYPDNPRHPQQKYYLTELGIDVLEELSKL